MKNKLAATFLVLVLIAFPGLLPAQPRTIMRAQIPFVFMVNGHTMPAGSCTIDEETYATKKLLIRCGKQQVFVFPHTSQLPQQLSQSSLVFNVYGDRYFLSSIRCQGDKRGYEVGEDNEELKLRAQEVRQRNVILAAEVR